MYFNELHDCTDKKRSVDKPLEMRDHGYLPLESNDLAAI